MPVPHVALLVTTYQMPWHLRRTLESIACQRTHCRLEVIVADDGSVDETADVVAEFSRRAPFAVRFVTHPHAGFQAARCRNEGVRRTTAPHLLFVDGDCLLPPDHVEAHLQAHRPGLVTSGYCVRLDPQQSQAVTLDSIRRGGFTGLGSPAEYHKLSAQHRKAWWYGLVRHRSKPALKSTDFSLSRSDFERVNGFDERFQGWGCEDDDLGRRLRAAGLRPVSVLDRTRVYHLWHPPAATKPAEWRGGANVAYLNRPLRLTRCLDGLSPRSRRDITVRLAGDSADSAALTRLIKAHGWHIECDARRLADLELLPWPCRGRFRGQGDCRVLAVLAETPPAPWRARQAQIVLSPSGTIGRTDQAQLKLTDAAELWQILVAGQPSVSTARLPAAADQYQLVPRPA